MRLKSFSIHTVGMREGCLSKLKDYLVLFGIAGVIVALDQITKYKVRTELLLGETWFAVRMAREIRTNCALEQYWRSFWHITFRQQNFHDHSHRRRNRNHILLPTCSQRAGCNTDCISPPTRRSAGEPALQIVGRHGHGFHFRLELRSVERRGCEHHDRKLRSSS